jgi:hypothetical protein
MKIDPQTDRSRSVCSRSESPTDLIGLSLRITGQRNNFYRSASARIVDAENRCDLIAASGLEAGISLHLYNLPKQLGDYRQREARSNLAG